MKGHARARGQYWSVHGAYLKFEAIRILIFEEARSEARIIRRTRDMSSNQLLAARIRNALYYDLAIVSLTPWHVY